ncbi:MAG: hypothetical protein HONBIEJF_02535 [Fimbriimonadaceae bacterium]|nr:hypothetical protein [Fimbriimonadaceae bacterium]
MPTVTYTNINGRIWAEKRGGTRRVTIGDPLGNVRALASSTGSLAHRYTYWPYGAVRTGDASQTTQLYSGTLGPNRDSSSRTHMGVRELLVGIGRWSSRDALWPRERSLLYAAANPISLSDPRGLKACFRVDDDCKKFGRPFSDYEARAKKSCEHYLKCLSDIRCSSRLALCLIVLRCPNGLLEDMKRKCDGTHCINIWCCKNDCCGCSDGVYAVTRKGTFYYNCGINLCPDFGSLSGADQQATFLHEISHCSGTDDITGEVSQKCAAQDVERCLKEILGRFGYV